VNGAPQVAHSSAARGVYCLGIRINLLVSRPGMFSASPGLHRVSILPEWGCVMSDPLTRSLVLYALSILAGAAAAALGALAVQLAGADPINVRPILLAAIGPIITGLLASRLPRPEGAQLAAQVDALKARNVPRHEMVVLSEQEAIEGLGQPHDIGRTDQ
jgi:hypothetical protein